MDENSLGRLKVEQKTGTEKFQLFGADLDFGIAEFWRWSASDLVSNTARGILAEFLVAKALGIVDGEPREEWAAFDLKMADGRKIEVKSAAFLQSWAQERPSAVTFGYGRRRSWNADTNRLEEVPGRQADIYVFALLNHLDKKTVDPMKLDQWRFYTASTSAIAARCRSQHSITLKSLDAECAKGTGQWKGPVAFHQLLDAINEL